MIHKQLKVLSQIQRGGIQYIDILFLLRCPVRFKNPPFNLLSSLTRNFKQSTCSPRERTQSEHAENQCLVSVCPFNADSGAMRRAKKYPCSHLSSSAHGGALRMEGAAHEREPKLYLLMFFSLNKV